MKVMAVIVACGFLAIGRPAAATPVLQIDGAGLLIGAAGINIGGALYDVQFVDSTCAAIFSGCDSTLDFDFTTQADALAAGNALLNQVFGSGDLYDNTPGRTFGCVNAPSCGMWIPYLATPTGNTSEVAFNLANLLIDSVGAGSAPASSDFQTQQSFVYADFTREVTSVAEPSSLLLFGSGLIAAVRATRRVRRRR